MVSSRYSYIAFEGPIGSKTNELSHLVCEALNGELIEDVVDNPFLSDFYKEKEGAAFQAQLYFLIKRHYVLDKLKQGHLFHQVKISDFIIEKDRIYAYQNLSDGELDLYEKMYPMLTADRVRPDLVVYLQVSPARIMETLRKRKDVRHLHISREYIETIVEGYNRFFFHYDETPLIILNANDVDFQNDREALDDLLSFFEKDLHGVTYYTPRISTV